MRRKFAKVVALLLAGPALAFVVLFAGCEGPNPLFGVMCGHNILVSLIVFTLAAWFVLAMAVTVIQSLRNRG